MQVHGVWLFDVAEMMLYPSSLSYTPKATWLLAPLQLFHMLSMTIRLYFSCIIFGSSRYKDDSIKRSKGGDMEAIFPGRVSRAWLVYNGISRIMNLRKGSEEKSLGDSETICYSCANASPPNNDVIG